MSDEFKKSEQPFEHLIRALQEGEARRISQCIQEIDHRLLDCGKSLEEYRRHPTGNAPEKNERGAGIRSI